jgi:hypothetical protein
MSASAAVRGLSEIPLTEAIFRQSETGDDAVHQYGSRIRVQSIANILRHSGYTITQLSNRTGDRYGRQSSYFIPPTFLYKLRSGVTPHICQIVALSESTGYCFVDWMRIFGFDLHQIPRLQGQLHPERTVLVTPIEFETASFRTRLFQSTSPIGESRDGLSPGVRIGARLGDDLRSATAHYFAKIGRRDALVSAELFPGMIVRIDPCCRKPMDGAHNSSLHNLLWLLEHPGGLTCSHLKWIGDHQVVLLPSRPPFGSLPLSLSGEARVLGLVSLEPGSMRLEGPQFSARPVKCEDLYSSSSPFDRMQMSLPGLLRTARGRTGLTFRAAREVTEAIASILGDPDYAIGLGLLSDYEAMDKLPRHIAKIISLCIAYCLDIRQLLETVGVYVDDSDKVPLPTVEFMAPFGTNFHYSEEPHKTTGLGGEGVRSWGTVRENFPDLAPSP